MAKSGVLTAFVRHQGMLWSRKTGIELREAFRVSERCPPPANGGGPRLLFYTASPITRVAWAFYHTEAWNSRNGPKSGLYPSTIHSRERMPDFYRRIIDMSNITNLSATNPIQHRGRIEAASGTESGLQPTF